MNRIRELRLKRKLTLDDVEKMTGINCGTFNNYESEKTHPKETVWLKLAQFFRVSVPYIKGKDREAVETLKELNMKEATNKKTYRKTNGEYLEIVPLYVDTELFYGILNLNKQEVVEAFTSLKAAENVCQRYESVKLGIYLMEKNNG
ncbi:helix-turn-helix transcriptional regulator [Lactobacillus sp. ESL0677]|uniref:helix-turn-helix domain-containing protein n=1 Tax=Lactobacillus sp. ESL0677 TaxID=2983208 RepID=UPI0023F75D39|nr:helix-turn-helix transcriptional regulator [Lactobacillus sp. ESL0677]WEV37710.1 helix-turn-helix transcriptional regulator [Lactobacillus sp. ESL0677]